jgi:large subunit ribosomal protein L5
VTDEKPKRRAPVKPAAKPAAKPAVKAAAPRAARGKAASAAPAETAKSQAPVAEGGGLRRRYRDEVVPAMRREFGYANPMQTPRLEKVVVNIGLGEAIQNAKALDAAVGDLTRITGQKPIVTKAKRSIAQFRLRTGMPIGAKVTLRGQRMYDFLERTMRLALPRIRDFRGISRNSFDGRGNFTLGLREQLVYPEIDYDKIDRLRGMEISIVTTATTDEEGLKLLQLLGMPFQAS